MGLKPNMQRVCEIYRNFWSLPLLVLLLSVMAGQGHAAAVPAVTGARIGLHPESVRLVFELDRALPYKIFTLEDPYRVVIDLPEVTWQVPENHMRASVGMVSGFRFGLFQPGNSRIVIDSNTPVAVKEHFIIPAPEGKPRRLVIDLESVSVTAFASGTRSMQSSDWSLPGRGPVASPRPQARQPSDNRRVVILDPGHGGVDPGTIGGSGIYEKAITLQVAQTAKKILEASGRYRVYLTRNQDVYVRLRDRFEVAHENNAELFISLHADSIRDRNIQGGSIYTLSDKGSDKEAEDLAAKENKSDIIAGADLTGYAPEVSRVLIDLAQSDTNKESWHLARQLISELKGAIKLLKVSHRYAGFAVLKSPNVPSALVELGYLSNRIDEKNLKDPAYQRRIGKALLNSIDKYFARKDENSRS
jgi:N-acetylmuramoyl-L-alanine amidase